MKRFIPIIILFLLSNNLQAQELTQDVVYLKNGSIIRGVIIEQIPNKTLKIRTTDGNVFVYNMDEITRITKEPSTQPQSQETQKVQIVMNQKSPGTAAFLSFLVPGLGNIYAEKVGTGFTEMFLTYAMYGMYSDDPENNPESIWLGVLIHFFSVLDSYSNAIEYNEKLLDNYSFNISPLNKGIKLTFSVHF